MTNIYPGEYFFPLDPAKRTPAQNAWAKQAKAARPSMPRPEAIVVEVVAGKIPVITSMNDLK